jgi:hypothetical protein
LHPVLADVEECSEDEAEIAFSAVPQDIAICEERFEDDEQYREAVTYMHNICEDGVQEDVYNTNGKYREAIAVAMSPYMQPSKRMLTEKLTDMTTSIVGLNKKSVAQTIAE